MEINKNGTSSVICMMFFWLPELHKLSCSFNEPWKDGVEDDRTIGSRTWRINVWVGKHWYPVRGPPLLTVSPDYPTDRFTDYPNRPRKWAALKIVWRQVNLWEVISKFRRSLSTQNEIVFFKTLWFEVIFPSTWKGARLDHTWLDNSEMLGCRLFKEARKSFSLHARAQSTP